VTTPDRTAWADPGVTEVAPGVHRVPLPLPGDGLRAVNVYVLGGGGGGGIGGGGSGHEEGLVLIDGGWAIPAARTLLDSALDGLGATVRDIARFLVTHVHRDHYTQAVAVRRETGARVGLGSGERPTLELLQDTDRDPLAAQGAALRAHGADELADRVTALTAGRTVDRATWESPDEWLAPGALTAPGGRVLAAVATPGHTAGHLVFHDTAAALLFAGDHVLPTITPSIGFEPVLSPDPLGAFLRSLAVVRARPDARLLPAHGPVADSVHARVDELIAHHGHRLDEVEAAVAAGASTATEAAAVLRWTRREHRLADLDTFNAMLAVFETAAHLQLLGAQGRLRGSDVDGIRRWS